MIDITDPAVQARLLARPCLGELSRSERVSYRGRRLLVTGAGGAVGSELVRRLASCAPESITLVEQSEYLLFHLERDVVARWPRVECRPILGDVTRARVMRAACDMASPHVVFHAAAYKHVTMLERDVCAGVRANVLGTASAVDAARDAGARFVLISSGQAVTPRSVMGATKRLAEIVTLSRLDRSFRPVIVRFGNVLGSSGSVVELMARCLDRREAIPVTHQDATRYFMTVGEATSLVLRADCMGLGGRVCWLDMGQPVRILDLAHRLIDLAVAQGTPRVPVKFIGLRAGEKLDEDLTLQGMNLTRTDDDRIWIAQHGPVDRASVRRIVRSLRADLADGDALAALTDLCAAVPEYEVSADARRAAGATTLSAVSALDTGTRRLVA